jgi:hypothetical protein
MPKPFLFIAAGLLFIGALPLPYGYYMLLRFIACGVFAWAAFITYENKEEILPWVFGVLAIVFNPIIKIHFPKEVWAIIDFCSGSFLLIMSKKLVRNEKKST